ncbi:MAG: autotransporter domain-containing protein [Chlamydiia bacterium]
MYKFLLPAICVCSTLYPSYTVTNSSNNPLTSGTLPYGFANPQFPSSNTSIDFSITSINGPYVVTLSNEFSFDPSGPAVTIDSYTINTSSPFLINGPIELSNGSINVTGKFLNIAAVSTITIAPTQFINITNGGIGLFDFSTTTIPNLALDSSKLTCYTSIQNITNLTLTGATDLTFNNSTLSLILGAVSGSGNCNIGANAIAGSVVITQSSPYTGNYNVQAGSLTISGSGNISAGSSVNLGKGSTSGTLFVDNASTPVTIQNLQGTNGIVNIGTNTLTVSLSTTCPYSGQINGSGDLNIVGAGKLILSESPAYASPGVLTVGDSTNPTILALTGSSFTINCSQINVADNAILDISSVPSVSLTNLTAIGSTGQLNMGASNLTINATIPLLLFDGLIQGASGSLNINGMTAGATYIIQGNQPYTSPTVVNGAKLSLSSPANLASSSITINAGSELDWGGGAVTINNLQGGGTVLTNTSSNPTLTIVYTDNVATNLIFSGSGPVNIQGTGKLNLQQNFSSYSGTISLDGSSSLGVNADLGSLNVIVGQSATLFGAGTLANLTSSGTISPGNSIGALYITGNYNQPAGVLKTEVDANGNSDRLLVTGNVILGGQTTVIPNPGLYQVGVKYPIINYGGTLTGQFTNLLLPSELQMHLEYDAADRIIYLVNDKKTHVVPVDPSNLPDYPREIANALFCDNVPSGSELDQIKQSILQLQPDQYVTALTRLAPGQMSGIPIIELENTYRINSLIQNRILRSDRSLCNISTDLPKWTFWFTPTTFWLWQQSRNGTFAFHSNTAGITIGFENNAYENLLVGLGTGYTYSGITWKNSLGNALLNEVYLAPYLAGRWENLYFSGSVMGSYDRVRLKRHLQNNGFDVLGVHLAGYDRIATSYLNQWNLTTMFDTRAHIYLKDSPIYMSPEGSIIFAQLFRQSANESGAGTLDMEYPSGFNSNMRININWAAGVRDCIRDDLILNGKISIGYQYTNLFTSNDVTANFIATEQVCSGIDIDGSRPSPNQGVAAISADIHKKDFMKSELKGSYTFGGRSSILELDLSFEFLF